MLKVLSDREENNVKNGENATSPFPTMFLENFFLFVFESWDFVVKC